MVKVVSTEYVEHYSFDSEIYNDLICDTAAIEQLEKQRKKRAIKVNTDYSSLGSSPYDETPVQVGADNYTPQMKKEAAEFIRMLYGLLGDEFGSSLCVKLRNKAFPHDFGSYHEVCVFYDPENEQSVKQALWIEANTPAEWDNQAKKALGL